MQKIYYSRKDTTTYAMLFIVLLTVTGVFSVLMISGGITDDTYNYIRSSIALPWLKNSVFPVGYPLAIKLINFFVDDFFFTTRILSLLGMISIGAMSFYFKFYTRETVLVLGMKVFTIFLYATSETLFLPVFYAVLLGVHFILQGKNSFLLLAFTTTALIALFAIRYSGLFVWVAVGTFVIARVIFTKGKEIEVNRNFLKVLFFSLVGIIILLIYNYLVTGALLGENNRNPTQAKELFDFAFFLKNIVFSFFMAGNPISDAIRISGFFFICSFVVSGLFWSFLIYNFWISRKKIFENQFLLFLSVTAVVYLGGMLYSSYTTGIDGLHLRLSLPIIFCLFLILVIINKDLKIFLIIAVLSIAINTLLIANERFDYLEKKRNVTRYLEEKQSLKYYNNDVGTIPTETGGTKTSNFFTLFSINPGVVEISDDEVKKTVKDSIIFELEMVGVAPVNRTHMINNKVFTR